MPSASMVKKHATANGFLMIASRVRYHTLVLASLFARLAPLAPHCVPQGPTPTARRSALRAALRLKALLGSDGRIVRIGLLRGYEMLPGCFEDSPTAKFPRLRAFGAAAFSPPGSLRSPRPRLVFLA